MSKKIKVFLVSLICIFLSTGCESKNNKSNDKEISGNLNYSPVLKEELSAETDNEDGVFDSTKKESENVSTKTTSTNKNSSDSKKKVTEKSNTTVKATTKTTSKKQTNSDIKTIIKTTTKNTTKVTTTVSSVTVSQQNALKKAKDYLRVLAFSYSGLIEQLEYEGFSYNDSLYAVNNCDANWNEQAKKKAAQYLSVMSFSKEGLISQL